VTKSRVDILERALKRERAARKLAEGILEDKSKQLFELSEKLKETNAALEGNLSEKTLELQAIFDNSSLGIVLTRFGQIVEVNQAFCELLGYSNSELKVLDVKAISVKDDYPQSRELMQQLDQGLIDNFSMNKRYVKKNEDTIWAKTNVAAIRDNNGALKYQVALVEDITEDLKLASERQSLIANLESKNKDLRDFAQVVSHDLKSPLRSMDTLINWLQEAYQDNDKARFDSTFHLLLDKVSKMDSLIDGVLRYSSIDNAKALKEPINTNELLKSIVNMLYVPAHIFINYEQMPTIIGDVYRIQQLFQNLLSNALKSIDKAEGRIQIKAEETEEKWLFSITDNGKGISDTYKDKIFEMFQSIEDSQNKATGIGLAIVKKIVEFYQGKIWFESQLGKGSTFYFTLKK
jgi:PAS domain S-box-containing protein